MLVPKCRVEPRCSEMSAAIDEDKQRIIWILVTKNSTRSTYLTRENRDRSSILSSCDDCSISSEFVLEKQQQIVDLLESAGVCVGSGWWRKEMRVNFIDY